MFEPTLKEIVYNLIDIGDLQDLSTLVDQAKGTYSSWFKYPTITHQSYKGEVLIGEIWERTKRIYEREAAIHRELPIYAKVYGTKVIDALILHKEETESERRSWSIFMSNDKIKRALNLSDPCVFKQFQTREHFKAHFPLQEYTKELTSLQIHQLSQAWDRASDEDRRRGDVAVFIATPTEKIADRKREVETSLTLQDRASQYCCRVGSVLEILGHKLLLEALKALS